MEIERRDIEWYEGYYQVSNTWLVKSLDRYVACVGWYRKIKGRILKLSNDIKKTSLFIILSMENIRRTTTVSRIVVETFIRRLAKEESIFHKDWNYKNNNVDNLSIEKNMKELMLKKRDINSNNIREKLLISNKKNKSKRISQYTLDWEYIQTFKSISDALEFLWKSRRNASNITCCAKWKFKQTYWYIRKFVE